jgi:hypothetical protein
MKKLLSLLVAAVFALSFSFATFAEDKKPADKPEAAHSTTKKKSKKTAEEKKAAADKKKAEQDAAKGAKK